MMPTSQAAGPPVKRRSAWLWVLMVLALLFALALSNCAGFAASTLMQPMVVQQLNEDLEFAQQDLDAALEQLAAVQRAQSSSEAEVRAAEGRSAELQVELGEIEEETVSLQDRVEQCTEQAAESSTQLATLTEEREVALASITTLEGRVQSLEGELAAAAVAPAPAQPVPLAGTGSTGSSSGTGGSSGSSGGSVYYANCDAVRAAGRAPLLAGSPGYRAGLDRDRDGVACE